MSNASTRTTSPPWWRLAAAIAATIAAALTVVGAFLGFANNGDALFDAAGVLLLSTGAILPYQLAALALLAAFAACFIKAWLADNDRETYAWVAASVAAGLCYWVAAFSCDAALRHGAGSLDAVALTRWLQVALLIAAIPVGVCMLLAMAFFVALAGPGLQDWAKATGRAK